MNEDIPMQQPDQSLGGRIATPRDMYGSSAIKELTNPFAQLKDVEYSLKGYRKVGGEYQRMSRPLMNQEGINSMMVRLQSFLSSNTTMTDIKDSEVRSVMHEITYDICMDLMLNRKKYGIENSETRTQITTIVLVPIFLALKRSSAGGERRFWKGSLNENINYSPQKRGWLGGIFSK